MARTETTEAVLVTGVYGSGKSSVIAEMAYLLRGQSYAAIDLDWLAWHDTGDRRPGQEEAAEERQPGGNDPTDGGRTDPDLWLKEYEDDHEANVPMLVANLRAIVGNYLDAGVRLFLLAGTMRSESHLERVRGAIPMPLRVVRLTLPYPEIERRIRSDVTTERKDDLAVSAAWIESGRDAAIGDVTVSNEGPIEEVAGEVLAWLGWPNAGYEAG